MRILHIIPTLNPKSGGPPEAVLGLSAMLSRMGHKVEIACLESEKDLRTQNVAVRTHALGRGIGRHTINPRLSSWMFRHAQDYDCVVVHSLWNYASIGIWLALRKRQTPYFIVVHGMMARWFRDQFPLKHIVKQVYWWLIQGRAVRDAKSLLFTCEEERVDARNVFSGFGYRERVIKYGTRAPVGDPATDKARFFEAFPELRGKRFLLCLCRIHPIKGCDLLLKTMGSSTSPLPPDVHVMVAGPDETGWVRELKLLAVNLGIENRVHWPGMIKGEVKWGALRAAEAMILPSHHENFGFVVAEAMACATPVLISNKVNIWREVQASGGGLVEPDTQPGTECLIRRFYSLSDQERARMSRAAIEGFHNYFDLEVTALDFARAIGALKDEAASDDVRDGGVTANRHPLHESIGT